MGIDWDGVYEIGSPKALDARQYNILHVKDRN